MPRPLQPEALDLASKVLVLLCEMRFCLAVIYKVSAVVSYRALGKEPLPRLMQQTHTQRYADRHDTFSAH